MVSGDDVREQPVLFLRPASDVVDDERRSILRLPVGDDHYVRQIAANEACHNVAWEVVRPIPSHFQRPPFSLEKALKI